MKKKFKWIIIVIAVIIITVVVYTGALVRYGGQEVATLNNYTAALVLMPEVDSVRSIHHFNGLESYVVALVELTNNQEVYFFIRDGIVQHYIESNELINESQIVDIALNLIVGGKIDDTQLGIIEETPIFEVHITLGDAIHYVIINAINGNVIMNFSL